MYLYTYFNFTHRQTNKLYNFNKNEMFSNNPIFLCSTVILSKLINNK